MGAVTPGTAVFGAGICCGKAAGSSAFKGTIGSGCVNAGISSLPKLLKEDTFMPPTNFTASTVITPIKSMNPETKSAINTPFTFSSSFIANAAGLRLFSELAISIPSTTTDILAVSPFAAST